MRRSTKEIAMHLATLEDLLNQTLTFDVDVAAPSGMVQTSIAVGPSRTAGPENSANVLAIENARRAIPSMKKLWGIH